MRLGALFIAICALLIAASAGATVYLGFGFAGSEAITVALAVLTALMFYNTVSTRLGVRSAVDGQLAELVRGNADMARQVGEMGRRVVALEGRVESALIRTRAAAEPLAVEVGDLGALVKQLAESLAEHETKIAELAEIARAPAMPPAPVLAAPASTPIATAPIAVPAPVTSPGAIAAPASPPIAAPVPVAAPAAHATIAPSASNSPLVETAAPAVSPEPEPVPEPESVVLSMPPAEDAKLPLIRSAIEANRVELHLQPIVTLPQRRVRYYEAMSRLRTEQGDLVLAADFVPQAEAGGLMPQIDNLAMFRCVQVVRRLLLKNRDIGLFCNLSVSTLADAAVFGQMLDFLEANRAIASSVVLEFTQSALRAAGAIETESLAALADRGFRFSLDNLKDLRFEPRELASRGFRFVKVPESLLLSRDDAASDIHPADLSDLLGRFGIDLIAEKIENEGVVPDLLDYDVRFGQGFLFSPPRPVRAEALQGVADRVGVTARDSGPATEPPAGASGREPPPGGNGRRGLAQLARGIVTRN